MSLSNTVVVVVKNKQIRKHTRRGAAWQVLGDYRSHPPSTVLRPEVCIITILVDVSWDECTLECIGEFDS